MNLINTADKDIIKDSNELHKKYRDFFIMPHYDHFNQNVQFI